VRRPQLDKERGLYALIAAASLVVIYVVAFIVSNSGTVKLSFVLFDAHLSLIILMVACLAIGFGLGVLVLRVLERGRRSPEPPAAADAPTPRV
jgi:uncharacterized integral membrane protein